MPRQCCNYCAFWHFEWCCGNTGSHRWVSDDLYSAFAVRSSTRLCSGCVNAFVVASVGCSAYNTSRPNSHSSMPNEYARSSSSFVGSKPAQSANQQMSTFCSRNGGHTPTVDSRFTPSGCAASNRRTGPLRHTPISPLRTPCFQSTERVCIGRDRKTKDSLGAHKAPAVGIRDNSSTDRARFPLGQPPTYVPEHSTAELLSFVPWVSDSVGAHLSCHLLDFTHNHP